VSDPIKTIADVGYEASASQLAALGGLARGITNASEAAGTCYLRVLVKSAQQMSTLPAADLISVQLEDVRKCNRIIYKAVCDGMSLEHLTPKERNTRTNWMRSQASTLTRYLKAGGGLGTLDYRDVTKAGLEAGISGMRESLRSALEKSAVTLGAPNPLDTAKFDRALRRLTKLADSAPDPFVRWREVSELAGSRIDLDRTGRTV
jgi:hypothetical protein